jgi:hypothetical protein
MLLLSIETLLFSLLSHLLLQFLDKCTLLRRRASGNTRPLTNGNDSVRLMYGINGPHVNEDSDKCSRRERGGQDYKPLPRDTHNASRSLQRVHRACCRRQNRNVGHNLATRVTPQQMPLDFTSIGRAERTVHILSETFGVNAGRVGSDPMPATCYVHSGTTPF